MQRLKGLIWRIMRVQQQLLETDMERGKRGGLIQCHSYVETNPQGLHQQSGRQQ